MNILLLGNGYDLHYGLPTKYENFLHTINIFHAIYDVSLPCCLGEIYEQDGHTLNAFQYGNNAIVDKQMEKAYKKYSDIYNELVISQKDWKTIYNLKNNYWFKFLNKSFNKDVGWIDFEREIQKVLECFEEWFNENFIKQISNEILSFTFNKKQRYCHVISHFNFFYVSKNFDNIRDDGNLNTAKFISKDYKRQEPEGFGIYVIDKEKIIEKLYEELEELSNGLKVYLKLFVENVIKDNRFKELSNFEEKLNDIDHIITLNYTNTYEALHINNFENVYHLHGNVNNDIVLGVNSNKDDAKNDKNTEVNTTYLSFKKYYQRVIKSTDLSYIQFKHNIDDKILSKTLSPTSNIYLEVFGHSLDKTDEDVIKYLFSVADNILIYYCSTKDLNKKVHNLISIYGRDEFDNIRLNKNLEFMEISEV